MIDGATPNRDNAARSHGAVSPLNATWGEVPAFAWTHMYAWAYCPAVFVWLLRESKAPPVTATVTTPAPSWRMEHSQPTGRLLGRVKVIALAELKTMRLRLSEAVAV